MWDGWGSGVDTIDSPPGTWDSPVAATGSDWGEHGVHKFAGWDCHWRRYGPRDGEALVLLHGFGACSGHWRGNVAGLAAAGFQIYALDLLGFGRSDQPGIALDNRLWSRQLQHFLQHVVGAPAVLVGNSIGGLVALTTAVFRPELVLAVVAAPLPDPSLLAPLPRRRSPWKRRWHRRLVTLGQALLRLPLPALIWLLRQPPLLRLGLASAYHRLDRIDHDLLRLVGRPAARPTAARSLNGMVRGMGLRPRAATAPALLSRLERPLLLLWGARDRLVPPAVARQVVQRAPRHLCRLHWLEAVGHCPHDEDPEAFNAALLAWLRPSTP
jgi:pimeloyl-ACP methyl ester carboxylesterase